MVRQGGLLQYKHASIGFKTIPIAELGSAHFNSITAEKYRYSWYRTVARQGWFMNFVAPLRIISLPRTDPSATGPK